MVGRKDDIDSKAHGDKVIADALTLDEKKIRRTKHVGPKAPPGSIGYRKDKHLKKRKADNKLAGNSWQKLYNFA